LALLPLLLVMRPYSLSSQLLGAFSDAGLPAYTTSIVAVAPAGTQLTDIGRSRLLLLLSDAAAAALLCSCCSTDKN
jgi:hypothetical protein